MGSGREGERNRVGNPEMDSVPSGNPVTVKAVSRVTNQRQTF